MPTDLDFIHQFIPGSSNRTLLLLHGTGGDENDLIPLGRELDPAAALLSPRGKVLENGYPRFFRRLAEGVFDLEDLKQRTDELSDFVVAAAEHYHFDARNLVAVGYSNGANIAASILLRVVLAFCFRQSYCAPWSRSFPRSCPILVGSGSGSRVEQKT